MLNLEKVEREVLVTCGALVTDDDGEETLQGLTVAEACFVLTVEHGSSCDFDPAERRLYSLLKARHVAARTLYVAALTDSHLNLSSH